MSSFFMFQNKNFLNTVLATLVCALSVALYFSWTKEFSTLPVVQKPQTKEVSNAIKSSVRRIPPEKVYDAIRDQNLFSVDRKEYIPEEIPAEVEEKPVKKTVKVAGTTIELYGVIQIGDKRSGLLLNPVKDAEKKRQWVVAGDTIGDLEVTKVMEDSVMLRGGGQNYKIKLHTPKRGSMRPMPAKKAAPKVVSTGGDDKSSSSQKPPVAGDAGTKVIHTPFGDIIRKK